MEINELYMESEFILGGESYCRKCIFSIPAVNNHKLRTTVTFVVSDEASIIDGYAEIHDGIWNHLTDILPKDATLENLKLVQKELVKSCIAILDMTGNTVNFNEIDFNKYEMFKWDDLESKVAKEEENVLTLEFNPNKI